MLALPLLALASSALALPAAIVKRAQACSWNSVLDSANFTLLAVNNANTTVQRPLALGTTAGFQPGVSVLGTEATLGAPFGRNLSLAAGAISSIPVTRGGDVQLSAFVPFQDGLLEFISKAASATGQAVDAYCELFNTSPHGVPFPFTLAVNGDADNFSICAARGAHPAADIVVYLPANGTALPYDSESCEPVTIHSIHNVD